MEKFRRALPPKYRNVSYLNKSLTEMANSFGVSIAELFELDYNKIPLPEITRWCSHFHTRYLYVHVLLSRDDHYLLLTEFEKKRDYAITREKIVEEINYEYNLENLKFAGSLMTFRILYDHFDRYKLLSEISQFEIIEKMDEIKSANVSCNVINLVKCAKFIMQKHNIPCDNLDKLYDIRYKLKYYERFCLLSDWHKQICDLAEKKHRQRLLKTSSCLEETLSVHLSHEMNKVTLFETHVEQHFRYKNYTENPIIKAFFKECSIDDITKMIYETYDSVECRNERVKSQHTKHSALQHVNYCLSILRIIPDINCAIQIKSLKPTILLNQIEDRREQPNHEMRRHFNNDEIDKMFDICKNDPEFTCILRLLRETGLRVNALVSMKISDIMNFDGIIKNEASVLDKGKKLRTILLSENMRNDFQKHLSTRSNFDRNDYLFTQRMDIRKHMTTIYVRKKLIKVANDCGVHGIHVHPHAFRHTLVNNLMSMGNDIHNVSKFIGHSSTSTTETYYWTSKITDIVPNMTIPWLNKFQTINEDEDMEQIATDMLMVCVSILTQEQRKLLKERIPNIDALIEELYTNVSSICEE